MAFIVSRTQHMNRERERQRQQRTRNIQKNAIWETRKPKAEKKKNISETTKQQMTVTMTTTTTTNKFSIQQQQQKKFWLLAFIPPFGFLLCLFCFFRFFFVSCNCLLRTHYSQWMECKRDDRWSYIQFFFLFFIFMCAHHAVALCSHWAVEISFHVHVGIAHQLWRLWCGDVDGVSERER